MNELFSPLRRRVELSMEPPFVLGSATVRPAALEVAWPSERVETLEPRVMQVLVALHRARGEPVSRDELSELCWEGRIVGEDALNRCVARLRKVLACDPRLVIDTIPKIGYRLRAGARAERGVSGATASVVDSPAEGAAAPLPSRKRRTLVAAAAGGAVVATAAAAFAYASLRPANWAAEGVRPLTSEPGVESHPALSPDGRFLVYAGGDGFGAPRDIYLRAVGEGAPMRLTATTVDELAPAWSPDGRRVAFVRSRPDSPCLIVALPVPRGPERVLGECRTDASTRLAWTADGEVVFADRARADAVRRLRAVRADTGAVRDVTRPGLATLGDSDPVVSPDGRSLVFRRSLGHGVDDLWRVDLRTGAERPITEDGWKAVGYAFAPDGRTLFYSSNRGGDFGLWAVDATRSDAQPRRVSLGLLNFGRLSIDRDGRLATESSEHRSNLFAVRAGVEPAALTASSGSDYDPDLRADGALVYVSDQSGSPELWTRTPGAEPARVTDFKAGWIGAPRWSPDGARLAFLVARDHRTDLYVANPDGSGLRRVTRDGGPKADVAWAADGRSVVFAARGGAGWRLERATLDGRVEPLPGAEGLRNVRRGPDGRFYGLKPGDTRLWRATGLDRARPVSPVIRVNADHGWSVGAAGVYQLVSRPEAATLSLTDWTGALRTVTDLPRFNSKYSLAVSADAREFVIARMVRDEADLMLIELKRRG